MAVGTYSCKLDHITDFWHRVFYFVIPTYINKGIVFESIDIGKLWTDQAKRLHDVALPTLQPSKDYVTWSLSRQFTTHHSQFMTISHTRKFPHLDSKTVSTYSNRPQFRNTKISIPEYHMNRYHRVFFLTFTSYVETVLTELETFVNYDLV